MERQYGAKVLVYLAYQNPDKSIRYLMLVNSFCNQSAYDSLCIRVERNEESSKSFHKVQSDRNSKTMAAFLRWAEETYGEF
jgi:hypothetical protein